MHHFVRHDTDPNVYIARWIHHDDLGLSAGPERFYGCVGSPSNAWPIEARIWYIYDKSSTIQTLLPSIFGALSSTEIFTFVSALLTVILYCVFKGVHRRANSGLNTSWVKPVEGSLRKEIKGHAVREENREDAHLPPESIF